MKGDVFQHHVNNIIGAKAASYSLGLARPWSTMCSCVAWVSPAASSAHGDSIRIVVFLGIFTSTGVFCDGVHGSSIASPLIYFLQYSPSLIS
jgi:hypothetical protein